MASRRLVMQELKSSSRAMAMAYIKAIRDKKILIKDVEEAVIAQDYEQLELLINVTENDLKDVIEEIRTTALKGGLLEKQWNKNGINFNSVAAMEWMQSQSGKLITNINHDNPETIRELLTANLALGRNPRATALDLVGRIGASGRREGGFIGLNAPQAQAVINARSNLASGDPALMRKYLLNERRDRRYDAAVRRYIDLGQPVPSELLDTITTRYEARLLQTRGETIGRTETIEALNFGQERAAREHAELLDDDEKMVKVWASGPADNRQRHSHREMNGQERELDQAFDFPDGSQAMFPSDTSLGAPAEQVINCRCGVQYKVIAA